MYLKYTEIMKKEAQVLVKMSPDLKEKLDQRAKALGMGTSTYVRTILIKEVKDDQ